MIILTMAILRCTVTGDDGQKDRVKNTLLDRLAVNVGNMGDIRAVEAIRVRTQRMRVVQRAVIKCVGPTLNPCICREKERDVIGPPKVIRRSDLDR